MVLLKKDRILWEMMLVRGGRIIIAAGILLGTCGCSGGTHSVSNTASISPAKGTEVCSAESAGGDLGTR